MEISLHAYIKKKKSMHLYTVKKKIQSFKIVSME